MSVGPRGGALRLRCWELASADTRRPSSTQASTRMRTPRDQSKLLQRSRIAQPYDKKLDAAQKTLDSLSSSLTASNVPESDKYTRLEDWDLGPASPAEQSTRGILLPPGEKDRFYGSFSGTQVESELKRLAMLVKGLLRDVTIVKDSVWHLEDERQEVREKLNHVENVCGLGEANKNQQLLRLNGEVETLGARLTASDDSVAQIAELAGRVELLDARLTACEDLGSWRSTKQPSTEAVLEDAMDSLLAKPQDNLQAQYSSIDDAQQAFALPIGSSQSEAAFSEEDVQQRPRWGRPSLPDNNYPEGRVPPGRSMKMVVGVATTSAGSDDSSPSSCANVGAEATVDFGTLSTAAPAAHSGLPQEAAASGCSPVPEDSSVHEERPPKMRGPSEASTASGLPQTPQPSEQLSSTSKSQLL